MYFYNKLIFVKQVFSILAFVFLVHTGSTAQEPAKKIPEFSFSRLDKTAFTNKDLATNKLLLFVFFDVECEHCQHAIKFIAEHYNNFKNTAIYLLTLDSQEKMTVFLNKYGGKLTAKKNVTLLQDTRQEFINKFKPRKYPSLFLYSKTKELLMYDDEEEHLPMFVQKVKNGSN